MTTRARRAGSVLLVAALLATGAATSAAATATAATELSVPTAVPGAAPSTNTVATPSAPSQSGWVLRSGSWYFVDGTTGLPKTGWLRDAGAWYLLGADGAMRTGWVLESGSWYHLGADGAMHTGWILESGSWYYLSPSGAMHTGWLLDAGVWHFLGGSGAMHTGWLLHGTSWYYLQGSGAMVTGTHAVDGKAHLFDSSGVWLGATSPKEYTLAQFMRAGIVHWQGYKFSYYSQRVLPGGGLKIPGRHVNADGYVSDGSGYIVLAAPRGVAHGTVYATPFGYSGKVYDTCGNCTTSPMWLDVYIR